MNQLNNQLNNELNNEIINKNKKIKKKLNDSNQNDNNNNNQNNNQNDDDYLIDGLNINQIIFISLIIILALEIYENFNKRLDLESRNKNNKNKGRKKALKSLVGGEINNDNNKDDVFEGGFLSNMEINFKTVGLLIVFVTLIFFASLPSFLLIGCIVLTYKLVREQLPKFLSKLSS